LRVALVNPNRYLEPPVIPVGIEYLAHYLDREGHEVEVIDLAFSPDPIVALRGGLESFDPQVVGFSLRNIDTSLYHDNAFFLDQAAELIAQCRQACEATVVVGGAALLAGPREVADYVKCDYAVFGPGERAFPSLLNKLAGGIEQPRLVNGWESSFDRCEVPVRGRWVDYSTYIEHRGVAGFVTQTGCCGDCDFCLEAGLPWRARDPQAVVGELVNLRNAGCTELHLCDCELNQDLDTAKIFLREMAGAGLDMAWTLYMKPLPHDQALFRLLAESGVRSLTLSVDSNSLRRGAYGLADLRNFFNLAREQGIRVAVDLLVGFPGEGVGEVREILDFFRAMKPDTVGVNAWIRIFKYTALGMRLRESPTASGTLEGDDPHCIRPVFYNWLGMEACQSLIGDDPLFRIEGLERRSNYERLQDVWKA
jgi:radical SAM superfamily enzyme YgiQ (UPF0313 family)